LSAHLLNSALAGVVSAWRWMYGLPVMNDASRDA
jgi:hypothetical protein